MATSPAAKARKCFAVAASTEHEGERTAAIDRGMAILEKNGLDPDNFDIPGRERTFKRSKARAENASYRSDRFGFDWNDESLARAAERMRESVRQSQERAARDAFFGASTSPFSRNAEARHTAEKLTAMGWRVEPEVGGTWRVHIGSVEFGGISSANLSRICSQREADLMRHAEKAFYDYDPSVRRRSAR